MIRIMKILGEYKKYNPKYLLYVINLIVIYFLDDVEIPAERLEILYD